MPPGSEARETSGVEGKSARSRWRWRARRPAPVAGRLRTWTIRMRRWRHAPKLSRCRTRRWSSSRAPVHASPSMRRIRAFCGVRLSVVTLPSACDAPSPGTRPLPTREQWATATPARAASFSASSWARGHEAGRESGRDDALRAGLHARPNQGAVRPRVGVDDVDAGKGVEAAHVELGVRGVPAQGRAVERHSVGVGVPQAPKSGLWNVCSRSVEVLVPSARGPGSRRSARSSPPFRARAASPRCVPR